MTQLSDSFFTGPERLESFPQIGRDIRKGSASVLQVSDARRVREALDEGNAERATRRLSIIRANSEAMVLIYWEFILSFVPALNEMASVDWRHVMQWAHGQLKTSTQPVPAFTSEPAVSTVLRLLDPEQIGPETVREFREAVVGGTQSSASEIIERSRHSFGRIIGAIDRRAWPEASAAFNEYFSAMRTIHDVLVDFDALVISGIRELHGQECMERVLYNAFTTCMFYEGLWAAVKTMSPEQVAAFLADHLRAHFSGPEAEGAVQVVEAPDRYRLIFAPCGSGGSMRLRAGGHTAPVARPLLTPTAQTWFRANEVPGYCSHCAINEMESVRRLGYPVFVTEFNPDPGMPCGWTVFKRPDLIPERFFTRIGARKPGPPVPEAPSTRTDG